METPYASQEKKYDWLKLVIVVVIVAAVTSVLTIWLMTRYLFPKEFEPVTLDSREKKVLNAKINKLEEAPYTQKAGRVDKTRVEASREKESNTLEPERYTENAANRKVSFSERELNGLIAQNTDLAPKLAIDLSENLASAKLLVPLDPDLPFFGGKTLRVRAGLELRYANQKPIVALKGISIWGVPVPNAWLGGIKNVDLVEEFGASGGFWQLFAAGVDDISVEEGQLTIKLKE